MVEEDLNQHFRFKNIDETWNYFFEEIEQNELMSKKHKKVCTALIYIEISYFSFYNYWMHFYFFVCVFPFTVKASPDWTKQ